MGKIAFVFPGQGAQRAGMGADIVKHSEAARRVIESLGSDAYDLIHTATDAELLLTVNTQPALFAVGLACAEALTERGVRAEAVAGFSLGEVTAATFCGLMDTWTAYGFVKTRAAAMQACAEANPGGMFAVIKLSAEDTENLCAQIDGVWPANYNYPGQTVVSCTEEAAALFAKAVTECGGKTVKLAVNGAFHSPLMVNASDAAAEYLRGVTFNESRIPLYANVTAMPYGDAADLLARQITSPVLWQRTIENMVKDGCDTFIETGPGAVLSGLIKKIDPSLRTFNVCDSASLEIAVRELAAM